MTIANLIDEARTAGLRIHTDDGVKLTIRGPQEGGDLARILLARKPEVLAALAGETCCGYRPPGIAGAPLASACQLCPHSPTYWRGPEHRLPAPPAAASPTAEDKPAPNFPPAPPLASAVPGQCGAGCQPCGKPARLYPGGWRCDQHAPEQAARSRKEATR